MLTLPACFVPDTATLATLIRIRKGYDVSFHQVRPLIAAGLVYPVTVPTASSEYDLTDNGTEALLRGYEEALGEIVI